MTWSEIKRWFNEHQGIFSAAGFVVGLVGAIDANQQRDQIIELLKQVLERLELMERRILGRLEELQLEEIKGKITGARLALAGYSSIDFEDDGGLQLARDTITPLANDLAFFVIGPLVERIDSTARAGNLKHSLDAFAPLVVGLELRQFCLIEQKKLFSVDTEGAIASMYCAIDSVSDSLGRYVKSALRAQFASELRDGEPMGRGLPPEKIYGYLFEGTFYWVDSLIPPFSRSRIEEARASVDAAITGHCARVFASDASDFIALKGKLSARASERGCEEAIRLDPAILAPINQ